MSTSARPIVVSFVYGVAGPDGTQSFLERVAATPAQEERIRQRLSRLAACDVIYDLYVGPEQDPPTPFGEFWHFLSGNPYILEHEAALAHAHAVAVG